ncbi:hypothetical protein L227DRAFT_636063 [Lentinus tigrinus ALCF2SS1-6]|uniref:Uncharacterized protein n=1 Tax=Lentinus tigrinus ALCF2SS1-6 TaxID=1328759 RepID=A0A5C2RYV6_9APHY|nr:hypothetical protein L227DRAFT_636063 [Lentinus tigrinus ALCF2SS1-6]
MTPTTAGVHFAVNSRLSTSDNFHSDLGAGVRSAACAEHQESRPSMQIHIQRRRVRVRTRPPGRRTPVRDVELPVAALLEWVMLEPIGLCPWADVTDPERRTGGSRPAGPGPCQCTGLVSLSQTTGPWRRADDKDEQARGLNAVVQSTYQARREDTDVSPQAEGRSFGKVPLAAPGAARSNRRSSVHSELPLQWRGLSRSLVRDGLRPAGRTSANVRPYYTGSRWALSAQNSGARQLLGSRRPGHAVVDAHRGYLVPPVASCILRPAGAGPLWTAHRPPPTVPVLPPCRNCAIQADRDAALRKRKPLKAWRAITHWCDNVDCMQRKEGMRYAGIPDTHHSSVRNAGRPVRPTHRTTGTRGAAAAHAWAAQSEGRGEASTKPNHSCDLSASGTPRGFLLATGRERKRTTLRRERPVRHSEWRPEWSVVPRRARGGLDALWTCSILTPVGRRVSSCKTNCDKSACRSNSRAGTASCTGGDHRHCGGTAAWREIWRRRRTRRRHGRETDRGH